MNIRIARIDDDASQFHSRKAYMALSCLYMLTGSIGAKGLEQDCIVRSWISLSSKMF